MSQARNYIMATISDLMEEKMGVKPKPDQHLKNDLNMDSLDIVELGMGLEHEFEVTIPDHEMAAFSQMTVQEVVDFMDGLIVGKPI